MGFSIWDPPIDKQYRVVILIVLNMEVTAACCFKEFIVLSRGNDDNSELCFFMINDLKVPQKVVQLAEPAFLALEWVGKTPKLLSAGKKSMSVWEVSQEL